MRPDQIDYLIYHLKADGVSFDAGLTDEEVSQVEQTFYFRFPPDLRAFLQVALPVSDGFVHWRWGIRSEHMAHPITEQRLQWPVDGLIYDVRNGSFWLSQWGARPVDSGQREQIARQHLASCPLLIPIYSHRYLPSLPHEAGNPVFSVMGSDIIRYGYDLFSYFVNEFTLHCPPGNSIPDEPRRIAFWSEFDVPRRDVQWGYWESEDEGELEDGKGL